MIEKLAHNAAYKLYVSCADIMPMRKIARAEEIISREYAPVLAAADALAFTLGELAHDTNIAQHTIDRARVELEAYRKARL